MATCEAPWERDWREAEENRMGRPKRSVPLTENERRQLALPDKVLIYLGLAGCAHNPAFSEEECQSYKVLQAKVLDSLDLLEKSQLCDYVIWRDEQMRKGGNRWVSLSGNQNNLKNGPKP